MLRITGRPCPDGAEQLEMRQHLTRVVQQCAEQLPFRAREMNGAAVSLNRAPRDVDAETVHFDGRVQR
jgi:hypothetical protein